MPDEKEVPAITEVEEKVIPVVEEEVEEETGEEAEEREAATRLYAALKNPKTAKAVIQSLAAEAGLLNTPAEKKEAKSTILDILSDSLGDEYKFLAPKLGPAIEKILGDQEKRIGDRFQEAQMREVERETNFAVQQFSGEFKDFSLHQPAIIKLMEKYTPGNGVTQREYLTDLYHLAKTQATNNKSTEKKSEKIEKSRNDIPGQLSGKSVGGSDKENTSNSGRPLTRKQAIAQALDDIQSGDKD